jgi:hypothetical protein
MAFRHGKATAIFLDSLDASPYFNSADSPRTIGTADVTAFGATGKAYIAGLEDAVLNASGFFDGDVGQIDDRLWALSSSATATYPATYCPDGGCIIGRQARLADCWNTSVTPSSPVGGAVTLKMSAQVSGAVDWGKVLNDRTAYTTTGTFLSASVDWGTGSTSAAGGQANIHVTTNTRTVATTVKVQHSVDNSVWVDLITQVVPAGVAIDATHPFGQPTAYAPMLAPGTVNRYVRASVTTVAGSGTITAVVAFARF